jgi:hypothetical protein
VVPLFAGAFLMLKDKIACVVDNGLFAELAVTLAKSFKHVYYLGSWVTAFPRSNALTVGEGLPNVTRINDIWSVLEDTDLFVFPDIYHGPLQKYLRGLGKLVWGSGLAESLEYKRGQSKQWLTDIGLPVGEHRVIRGLKDLRSYLQRHEGVYVKSTVRGDMETFRADNYSLIETRLDELEHVLGAKKFDYEFVVEEPIEVAAEVGYDGFTIDGQWPRSSLFGVEAKDTGYVGKVLSYSAMPRQLAYVNDKLSGLFEELNYRGFWSSEVRIAKDGTAYLIDPCCRLASPPGELCLYLIENLAEIIWAGADGELIEPEFRYPYAAQVVLKSDWAQYGWQPLEFPDELREHIKIHYLTVKNGRHYFVPQQIPIPEIGAVVAGGDSQDEAIARCLEIAEQVKGYDVKFEASALEKAADDLAKVA